MLDEFAVQTCYLGRYGEEIGSDQFGATIMVSEGNNSQRVAVRMSNVEVINSFIFYLFYLIFI